MKQPGAASSSSSVPEDGPDAFDPALMDEIISVEGLAALPDLLLFRDPLPAPTDAVGGGPTPAAAGGPARAPTGSGSGSAPAAPVAAPPAARANRRPNEDGARITKRRREDEEPDANVVEQAGMVTGGAKSSSPFHGVTVDRRKKQNQIYARIKENGVNRQLGFFPTELEAAFVYDEAARIARKPTTFVPLSIEQKVELLTHFHANSRTIGPQFFHFFAPGEASKYQQWLAM